MHQIVHSSLLHYILPLRSIPIRQLHMNKLYQCKPDYFKIKSGQKRTRTRLDFLDSLGSELSNPVSRKFWGQSDGRKVTGLSVETKWPLLKKVRKIDRRCSQNALVGGEGAVYTSAPYIQIRKNPTE